MGMPRYTHGRTTCSQRGAAALIVTLILFFALVLGALFVNRNLVFELRSSANQVRSTIAFEAAEAGLEWALAQLNSPQRIGADCRPSADPAATSFRSRYLATTPGDAVWTPRRWSRAGVAVALQPSCVRTDAGWSCSCPAQGEPTLAPSAAPASRAAFTLQFLPGARPGVVRVAATGCTDLAGACLPGASTAADATATAEVSFALLAGLRTPPVAALTTRGAFDAGSAAPTLRNLDPATGIALHAGADVTVSQARFIGPAGAPLADALVGKDAALAALTAERLFAAHFGIDKARWMRQPAVTRIQCSGDCSAALAAAIDAAADHALIWIDGDLALTGPITLGSAQRPVVIVASGAARFDGAIALHGMLYSAALRWDGSAGSAHGALISESGYQGDGTPDLAYDSAALAALTRHAGSFARVSGSWHDF